MRTFLTLSTIFSILATSLALHLGSIAGRGRGGKLESSRGFGRGLFREWEDERLHDLMAAEHYFQHRHHMVDPQMTREDNGEKQTEVTDEPKCDDAAPENP